ncbi:dihydrofolate reductase [Candidatus Methanophagaceae archaeon]|nr:dihydrofolate reductase [Methanophagales archaeon]
MEQKIKDNISIIVAIAKNRAIGKDNRLLWHISEDLKRFKKLTTGHTLIMGRNTFLSLPNGALPNRRHIVISDRPDETFRGCEMAGSIEEAIRLAGSNDECFVIGGGMVYAQFLQVAGKLYLTQVHESFEADTFFPEIDFTQWKSLGSEEMAAGDKNEYAHTFTEYIRN